MKTWWLGWVMLMFTACAAYAEANQAPLSVKNRFPLHLGFLTPRPVSAEPPAQGSLEGSMAIDYSAVYFNHSNSRWNVLIDMEMTTLDLAFSYGLTRNLGLRLDLPVVSMNSGFLDHFLEGYHDTLGVGNYGREQRPYDDFSFRVEKEGKQWVDTRGGDILPADMVLSALWAWRRQSSADAWPFSGAAMLSVKLPTGDTARGTGSGRADVGVYMPMSRTSAAWSFFLMPGVAMISDPDIPGAKISARESYSLFAGIAYASEPETTWLVQLNGYTSPLEETGIASLDDGSLELVLGFRHQPGPAWALEFAFCEDLSRTSPDFTLHLGLEYRWSSARQAGVPATRR